ncbi:MAG TPA: prepilin-type N-terminal cleavage/methylation domain-containing protein [Vicinamibacterales bacterium]|nr:prepilin-type N-terminal cleavage/methylation domain-containing protein [Vicinamibacterales bacterium]
MTTLSPSRSDAGFSLVEVLIATAIMLTVTGAIFTVLNPSGDMFKAQPEVVDMQQRLRVGVDTLTRDLIMAGAGAYSGSQSGSLAGFFAPILPERQGNLAAYDDGPGVFKPDALTLIYVPSTSAQTTITSSMPSTSAELKVDNTAPNCPQNDPNQNCGFQVGQQVLIYDDTGAYDTMTITQVQTSAAHLQHNQTGDLSKSYGPGAKVVQVQDHVYFFDPVNRKLMHYDGFQTATPVLDEVVGVNFEYYGEPQPPVMRKPGVDQTVTYGPMPPALGVVKGNWAAGQNCTINVVGGQQVPRLATLGAIGSGLVKLDSATLTDGPWCPDPASPNRFDADLFRIRKVRVTIRLQTGDSSLRGSLAGGQDAIFTMAGTGRGDRLVGDQQIRFDVTPRNMNLNR